MGDVRGRADRRTDLGRIPARRWNLSGSCIQRAFATVYRQSPKGETDGGTPSITGVSQDYWIFFPWDMALQYVEPYRRGEGLTAASTEPLSGQQVKAPRRRQKSPRLRPAKRRSQEHLTQLTQPIAASPTARAFEGGFRRKTHDQDDADEGGMRFSMEMAPLRSDMQC